jgi:hypothetical protein
MPVVVTLAVRILVSGSKFAVPLPVAVLALGGTSCAPVRVATNTRTLSSPPPPQAPNAASRINDSSHPSTDFALSDFIRMSPAKLNQQETTLSLRFRDWSQSLAR